MRNKKVKLIMINQIKFTSDLNDNIIKYNKKNGAYIIPSIFVPIYKYILLFEILLVK